MSWIKKNWKRALIVLATGTMALAADHTIGYKVAEKVLTALTGSP